MSTGCIGWCKKNDACDGNTRDVFSVPEYWDYSGGIATDLHYHTVAPFHIAVKNEHPARVVGMGGIWRHGGADSAPAVVSPNRGTTKRRTPE
jgi:hypothetical protein